MTKEQCKDAGLALVLISLILATTVSPARFLPVAIALLILAMSVPVLFRPFATVWFAFSHALGTVVSRVLLTGVFFLLVTPVGLVRRALGKDALGLRRWKQETGSVFQDRDHWFTGQDLDHPY